MTLPDYAELITQLDYDGYYTLPEGRCFVFPVPVDTPMTMILQQVGRNNQDFSLRCWFSLKPMGLQMFIRNELYDEFALSRTERHIHITDTHFGEMPWTPPANGKFYVNILNQENSPNFLKFLYAPPIDRPVCEC